MEKYCPVHFFHVAQQNDVLFTKEFISPICLSMRVRPKPNPMPGGLTLFQLQTHAGSKNLQRAACSLIVTISLNGKVVLWLQEGLGPSKDGK